jgi:2-polyprenyl-6-methoxyphenol hydroxylase-like FAD-dependent oxidoreductase
MAAAILLARAGHRVVVLERFDVPRPLGSGLMIQPTGLAMLRALGLDGAVAALAQPIDRLYGRNAGTGRVTLDVRYAALGDGAPTGLALHRAALFGVLHRALLAAGIPLETGVEITGLDRGADGRPKLLDARGRAFGPFDLVVDALGARSRLVPAVFGREMHRPLAYGALWATLPFPEGGPFDARTLEQRYHRASVMVGVLPIGRTDPADTIRHAAFFWSLKPAAYEAWRAAGLDAWKDHVRALWPETTGLLDLIAAPDDLVLARYGHHTLPRPFAERVAFIGDCAHATSPQLGQGANMALIDAVALATALEQSAALPDALAAYAAARRLHVRLYQGLSRVFTPFYQSDSRVLPAIRDRVVAPAARLPVVARILARIVAGTAAPPIRGP